MEIEIGDLRNFASRFLQVLEEQEVKSARDLERLVGTQVMVEQPNGDFVLFENRPSNLSTTAYTISYIRNGLGIPIELKINNVLAYSQIIIKTKLLIRGYSPFAIDPFKNTIQYKRLDSSDFSISKKELAELSRLSE